MARDKIDLAIRQMEFARHYTLSLLSDVAVQDWCHQPPGAPTHIAWQVGHLAMAQYALTMLRIRGKEREDEQWIDKSFFRTFQKGTQPSPQADNYPSVEHILSTFHAVHTQATKELVTYADEDLGEKLPEPHALFDTKLGSIFFCSAHELIHAGQIGLLRRWLGKPPIR